MTTETRPATTSTKRPRNNRNKNPSDCIPRSRIPHRKTGARSLLLSLPGLARFRALEAKEEEGCCYHTSNQVCTHIAAAVAGGCSGALYVSTLVRSKQEGHFLFRVRSMTPVGLPSTARTNAVPEDLRLSVVDSTSNRRARKRETNKRQHEKNNPFKTKNKKNRKQKQAWWARVL